LCSNTFSKIHASTEVVWKNQRYHLIEEFRSKPFLVPPFILFANFFLFVRGILRCCKAPTSGILTSILPSLDFV